MMETTGLTTGVVDALEATQTRRSPQSEALEDGGMRLAQSGVINVSDNLNLVLENPAGSGVAATLFGVVSHVDADSTSHPTMLANPTSNLPTTARDVEDTNLSTSNPAATRLLADDMASALSGGDWSMQYGIDGGRTEHRVYFRLEPGDSLGVTNPFSGLTSVDTTFSGWLIESPL